MLFVPFQRDLNTLVVLVFKFRVNIIVFSFYNPFYRIFFCFFLREAGLTGWLFEYFVFSEMLVVAVSSQLLWVLCAYKNYLSSVFCQKFLSQQKILFISFYTSFVQLLLLKFITRPGGSDWGPVKSSTFPRNLIKFAPFVLWSWLPWIGWWFLVGLCLMQRSCSCFLKRLLIYF